MNLDPRFDSMSQTKCRFSVFLLLLFRHQLLFAAHTIFLAPTRKDDFCLPLLQVIIGEA